MNSVTHVIATVHEVALKGGNRGFFLRAMADSVNHYSRDYLRHMERFSPLSFSYLWTRRKSVERSFGEIWPKLARQRKLASVFDLLG